MQTTRFPHQSPTSATSESGSVQNQSPVTAAIAPLTSQNLSTLTRKRSLSPDSTSPPSEADSEAESENDSQHSRAASRHSFLSDSSSMPDASTVLKMRNLLDMNQMYIDKPVARELGKAVIDKALKILNGKRGSDWSGPKAEQVQEVIQYHKNENEATFLHEVFHKLLGLERKVPVDDTTGTRNYIDRAWHKDFLRPKWDNQFVGDDVPRLKIPEENQDMWKAVIAAFPRISNPKPDISYSVDMSAYDMDLDLKKILGYVRCQLGGDNACYTFLAGECKCINSSPQEAENQCISDGATMCEHDRRCRRAFTTQPNDEIPTVDKPTPDEKSFVFTMVVVPESATIYVNWILVHPPSTDTYHMHKLRVYSFDDPGHVAALHHDLDNILDWGLKVRKQEMDKLAMARLKTGVVPFAPSPGPPPAKKVKTTQTPA
ncbi:uncharacterized protein KY384_000033 [Bacidia gigantensis]|uniref:uncharacterized protein n=1 Tax=Bacidia gigantensis TaxID=2732470 RepID=UPI001D054430|nr:uncharacterized protein KY384_000033 [Bacidia gigantensis]KAG8526440.1 hypothetical protein KY384_000033 [Bacidia gigantensis]